jgi:hypothetical protein
LAFAGAAGLAVPRAPRATRGAEAISTAALREWVIESFDVQVRVRRSGRIEVTETIRPRFTGSYNGIFRTIPIRYRDAQNFTYALALDVEEVTDGSGNELRYEESRERQYKKIKIWVPGASDATRTVHIRYSVKNGLRFPEGGDEFETWDELYWNVTGDEWPVAIEHASAEIVLPAEITGLRARAFTGAYGSTESAASIEVLENYRGSRELCSDRDHPRAGVPRGTDGRRRMGSRRGRASGRG